MIVKVNKKGSTSDCGCNKKLAKGGCAPKKKKIKKNKNGGYIMTNNVPSFAGGEKIYNLDGNQILNPDNNAIYYAKKVYNQKDRNPYYTEKIILHPQQSEHGIIDKEPTVIGTVQLDRLAQNSQADSTLKYLPTGKKDFYIEVNKTRNSSRNPVWDHLWKLINEGKQLKK